MDIHLYVGKKKCFYVNWIYKDGKLILLDKDSKPTNKTVRK